jgi:uncharacterized membrane protein YdjX (TVP38/TMEM64 family)
MPEPLAPAPSSVRAATSRATAGYGLSWPVRCGLIVGFLALIVVAYAMGWHRQFTLENLVRHRAIIDSFIAHHHASALVLFVGIYVAVVSLSIPVALLLSVSAGILFGPVLGPLASIVGATAGATVVFVLAKTAVGESLVRRAGSLAQKLADGFRANAFSYLLFLRLAPVFPFWLVNLAPALFGIPLGTFLAATALGVTPAAFAFGFAGAGLDSVIAAQEASYRDCLASSRGDCHLDFDVRDAVTPELLIALGALALLALIPIAVKRWCGAKPEGF